MRKVLSCVLLIVLGTLPFFALTDTWKRHNNSSGNFTVLFPGEPQDSVNKEGDGIRSHTLMFQDPPHVFTVVYTAMDEEQKVDEATYQIFRNAVFKELPNCSIGVERTAAPALAGYVGHWYRLNCDISSTSVTALGNLYWGKHYAYAVMVMFRSDQAAPQTTDKFLGSFGVLQ